MTTKLNALDRFAMAVSPKWGAGRVRSRMIAETMARHYEAAARGRRTSNWNRNPGDANALIGPANALIRARSRDLVRNNSWARRALKTICNNTVGWGIQAKPVGADAERAAELWRRWSDSVECDADGRLDFAGLQKLALRTVAESGEVIIRRRRRYPEDDLAVPLQLQVLEPDFIDTTKDVAVGPSGGPIVQGVEFDLLGRRVAYWLYEQHPGSDMLKTYASRRVSAADIAHVYEVDRPGQVRGVSWFAAAVPTLKDFDEFEDAQLMRQKIAACFAAFITDMDGAGTALGEQSATDPLVETLEPGMLLQLRPGQNVATASPPAVADDGFSTRTLRKSAAGIGVTYQDMTGDYSQVNFSSARMARIAHWQDVEDWRWLMLIPQMCNVAFSWFAEAAVLSGSLESAPIAEWTAPPMPMLEPDREGLALTRLVRGGFMTLDEAIRERGHDPETFYADYQACNKKLDDRGIMLDSDPRKTSQAGLTQERAGGAKQQPAGDDNA